jgi:methylated-DNA-[protein]-cysteine S-methyltransferase
MTTPFQEKVYLIVNKVPKGKVTTYKEIAIVLNTKAYQAIGQALKKNVNAPITPCHRVIRSDGNIGGYKGGKSGKYVSTKKGLLISEGVVVENNKIKLKKYLFKFY